VSGWSITNASGASAGGGTVLAGRPAWSASISSCALRRLGDAVEPALRLFEIGVDQLGLDRLDVLERIDVAIGVDDVRVVMGADDVDDRVGLADVREELVAEALAAVRAGDQAGDVMKCDRVGHRLRGTNRAGDRVQPLVLDRDDCHVRLDRRERVIRGVGGNSSQCAEERRFPRVRKSDDPYLHAGHAAASAVPSSNPASTSLG